MAAADRAPWLARFDLAFWSLPLWFHYCWWGVLSLGDAIWAAPNPRTFENVRTFRKERLDHHRERGRQTGPSRYG